MDRFGVRRTMTLALAVTAAAVALIAGDAQCLAAGAAVGRGCRRRLRLCRRLSVGLMSRRAGFAERQGLVVGVLTAANAAGQLVFLPTMASLVTHAGWRVMSLVLAARWSSLVPVVGAVDARPAGAISVSPPTATKRGPQPVAARPGNPIGGRLPRARRGRADARFLADRGRLFVCGATTNGLIGTHLIPACVDHGLSEVIGAGLLGRDRRVQLSRRHDVGLAQRPLGQPGAARLVLSGCAVWR